jgi:hypothetical protein
LQGLDGSCHDDKRYIFLTLVKGCFATHLLPLPSVAAATYLRFAKLRPSKKTAVLPFFGKEELLSTVRVTDIDYHHFAHGIVCPISNSVIADDLHLLGT